MKPYSETERTLYQTKWFDYRSISPIAADLKFIQAWSTAYNEFMEEHKLDYFPDLNGGWVLRSTPWTGFRDLLADSVTVAKAKALRRMADRHCMPYDKFWGIAYKVLNDIGLWRKGIDAVYSEPIIKASILDEYEELKKVAIPLSKKITVRTYDGTPGHIAYMAYLRVEAQSRYGNRWEEKLAILERQGAYLPINQLMD